MERSHAAPRVGAGAPPRRLSARRIASLAAVIALVPALTSYVGALTGRSNSGLGVRTVEWLRDNGARGLVNSAENAYYTFEAPAPGGPGLRSLPQAGIATTGGSSRLTKPQYRPPRIPALIAPALPGEGVWRAVTPRPGSRPPIEVTTFRSDPRYPRMVAGVAWIDHTRTSLHLYPGLLEPSVSVPRGTADVPLSDRTHLLATFNSGFKYADSHGGFAVDGTTYAPMQSGQATVIGYTDGRVDVIDWLGPPRVGSKVAFASQNLPLIVDGGQPTPNLSNGPEWGATLGSAVRVWRSGVGIDAHGNLIYAAADQQTVGSLAGILIHAGAIRAMELDINSYWDSFITYAHTDAGSPRNLLPSMARTAQRYLTPDDRDFFAAYLRG
ncbi:MAG TPA: phosphodiester glycosidase family protein [Solirubrobacteraceae bacterium]|jgi:hypothetical protein|nr:phosphodiester glycosidase family protein [Solirubrobacteraceae bacterium]